MAWYNTPIGDLFRRREKAISGTGFGAFFPTVAEPFGPSTYDTFAIHGYKKNSTANMCIRLIARAIAGLPLKIFTVGIQDGEDVEIMIDNHPLWKKIGQDGQPNFEMSWADFNQAYWAYAFLNGNNYIFAAGDPNMPELWPLRPDRVEPIRSKLPWEPMLGYKYTVNGTVTKLDADRVLHTKTFDPLSDSTGMPLLEPASVEIDQSNYSGLWNVSLLKHGGRMSLLISSEPGTQPPTPEQQKQMKQWASQNIEGFGNAGKITWQPGVKISEVGQSLKDMDWLKGGIQAKVAIANTCGVPPELIGIQDQKTYSNYQEARKAFYEETIIPLADDFFRSLTLFLGGRFMNVRRDQAEGVTIAVWKDEVEALQEAQDSKHKRLRDDIKEGLLTRNEGRKELAFPDVDGGDEILVGANLVPLDFITGAESDNETMPPFDGSETEDEDEMD
jgi:HK97 family phage portal protein